RGCAAGKRSLVPRVRLQYAFGVLAGTTLHISGHPGTALTTKEIRMAEDVSGTNWKQVEASRAILARSMRDEAHSALVCGHEYVVLPGVFPANEFYSTEFFTRE